VDKYGRARQATDGNLIRRTRFSCCLTKVKETRSECVILLAFPRQQWLLEHLSVTLIRTLPVMFIL
jgi:hypothetical protein